MMKRRSCSVFLKRLFNHTIFNLLVLDFYCMPTLATEAAPDSIAATGKDGGTFDEFVVTGVRDETALRHRRSCPSRAANHGSIGAY